MDEAVADKLRRAGRIASRARELAVSLVKEGVLYLDVAERTEELVRGEGAFPAFPVNITVGDEAAHFTPRHDDELRFIRGQVVKLDVGVHVDGYIGDTAATVEVGTNAWSSLIEASRRALSVAIEVMKPGVDMSLVGGAVERTVRSFGFKPVANLTGHSMERYRLHAGLSIPNVPEPVEGTLKAGDVVAVEPFATNGSGRVDGRRGGNIYRFLRMRTLESKPLDRFARELPDRFNALPFSERWCHRIDPGAPRYLTELVKHGVCSSYPVLKDTAGGVVSQAEHTLLITPDGCEVLTE